LAVEGQKGGCEAVIQRGLLLSVAVTVVVESNV
jgi:hypothetical protein